jgi:uncharacterized protein YbbC (DUF1343 family)
MVLIGLALQPAVGFAQVQPGCEVLAVGGFKELLGKRVGLITNPSGINRRGDLTLDVLRKARGVTLVALFAPEHGLYGHVQAGQRIEQSVDPRTGLPVYSLYGATRKPTAAMLKGLNALVYDLQDTGLRSYTFISTMGLAMEACAEAGIEFIVLDRPNPLGGERVEGPRLEERFRSFVSQWDVPYAYGLTCGELARMINGERWIKKPCRLTVVPLRGWSRSMVWRDTGLPWVPTSPAMPHLSTAILYPGMCLLEGTNLSLGRGTALPFEVCGAPWLDGHALAEELNALGLAGARFRPTMFTPTSSNHAGRECSGIQVHVTDRAVLRPVEMSLHLIATARRLSDECFSWNTHLERLAGSGALRASLEAETSIGEILAAWTEFQTAFARARADFLLYN